MDEGSSDDTGRVLWEAFGERIRYFAQANQGASAASPASVTLTVRSCGSTASPRTFATWGVSAKWNRMEFFLQDVSGGQPWSHFGGPVGTTPPNLCGGTGSSPAEDYNWFQERMKTATLGGQPGRGTENWLGKKHWGRRDDRHGVKRAAGREVFKPMAEGPQFPLTSRGTSRIIN